MTAKEYLLDLGFDDSHLPELFNDNDNSYYQITELMEEYHQAKLKLLGIGDVVRSVFTIHSTEDEGIIKIVGTEEEAKQQVLKFAEEHKYAYFFYEKQTI